MTYFSRIGLVWGLVILIVLLLGKLGYDGFLNFLSDERCKQPEPLARTEPKIAPINFPRQSSYQKATSYSLQLQLPNGTTTNLIPETPSKQMTWRVYPEILPVSNVSSDTRVRDIAVRLGLSGDPEIINSEVYRWQNGNTTFDYVTLDQIYARVKEDNNFAVLEPLGTTELGDSALQVLLVHKSGEVIISDIPINYPKVQSPHVLVALTQEALNRYVHDVREDAVVIVDSMLVKELPDGGFSIHSLPVLLSASDMVGAALTANIVTLGILNALSPLVSDQALNEAVKAMFPKAAELNMKALEIGRQLAAKQ